MTIVKIAIKHFMGIPKEQEDEYYLVLRDETGQEYEFKLEDKLGDWLSFTL